MKGFEIARRDLRACYGPKGIYAGLHQFKDYWARDAFFASLGALELGDTEIVKKNLELFLSNTRKGHVPLRIGASTFGVVLRYLGVKRKREPVYGNDKTNHLAIDSNALLIIAFHAYMEKTRDKDFLDRWKSTLRRIIDWYDDRIEGGLVREKPYSNWADSIKKQGYVLYTNVLYCHALRLIADLLKDKGYHKHHQYVKKKINELFWNGEHYIDWIHEDRHYSYFSTDGNMLAVLWNIADKEKAKHIEESSHIFDINDVPSQCVHPPYPSFLVSMQTKLLGLPDYHNGLSWLWLGSLNAMAKHKVNMDKDARQLIKKMDQLIVRHRKVYEVYEHSGDPVRRLIYRAESPFAWSAGMFILAHAQVH